MEARSALVLDPLPRRPLLPCEIHSLHRHPFPRQEPGVARHPRVKRFVPGLWWLLSQFASLVISFMIRAVDFVRLLCSPHPLLRQWA